MAIIRDVTVAGASRRLSRPGGSSAVSALPLSNQHATALPLREQALAAAQAELERRQAALAGREEQLNTLRRQLDEEGEAIRLAAQQRGYDLGVLQGQDAAREAAAIHVGSLNDLLQNLEQHRQALLGESEDLLVEISFAAICRVLGEVLTTRAGITAQIHALIAKERLIGPLTVRLHPQDWQLLETDRGTLDERLQLQPDDSVELGGCVVETLRGSLDVRLESQIELLREALMQVRHQRQLDGDHY